MKQYLQKQQSHHQNDEQNHQENNAQLLCGGRFEAHGGKTNEALALLNNSLPYDSRLFADDLDGSKAYAEALQRAGYLTASESKLMVKSLEMIRMKWVEDTIEFEPGEQDVYSVNERLLTEMVGDLGQRLQTGRSRNDQVVTDMKLWMRKAIRDTLTNLRRVIQSTIIQAEQYLGVVMPGYTHLQRAQPVQFSHWLLSHAFALREDCLRFIELRDRSNVLPLGSGELAGNSLGIDRIWLAERLGFKGVTENSMHTVTDRDFVIDFIYNCSLTSLHLSRLAEDIILYATKEFDFIKIADSFSTASSLMPQKRNPASLELVRGLSGVITANLTGIMMTVKGTPSTYHKDLQFDKIFCFQSFDKLAQGLQLTQGTLATMEIKRHKMESALSPDMLSADWANYLVRKGVPSHKAHYCIGKVMAFAEQHDVDITEIPLGELQKINANFDTDIASLADYTSNVEQYNAIGGTATSSIKEQLSVLKEFCSHLSSQE